MEPTDRNVPRRDNEESLFTPILKQLSEICPGFVSAVFFDAEGETIDYYSYLEPFDTRLTAAHVGLIIVLTRNRLSRLALGDVKYIEIFTEKRDYVAIALGESLFFAVCMESGSLTARLYPQLIDITHQLREEAGV